MFSVKFKVSWRRSIGLCLLQTSTMSTSARESAEEVFYKTCKYIAANPLLYNVHCMDVITEAKTSWVQRFKTKILSKMPEFVTWGSMLDTTLMAENSKWRSADQDLDRMRRGIADLENLLKPRPRHENFQKKKLPTLNLSFWTSTKGLLWLASVVGIELGKEESLSCTMEGLTSCSVDSNKILNWTSNGDWYPNVPILQRTCSDWAKNTGYVLPFPLLFCQ